MTDKKVIGELTQCSICFNTFARPKFLPCLHTFCEDCLGGYINSSLKRFLGQGVFNCPLCRKTVTVEYTEGDDKRQVAKQFPLNHQIMVLLEKDFRKENITECFPCQRKSKSVPAKYWCVECKANLCDTCSDYHTSLPALEDHKLELIWKNKKEVTDNKEMMCVEHPDKALEMYCIDHSKACCSTCTMVDHRKCDNVDTLPNVAKGAKTSQFSKDLETNLEKLLYMNSEALISKRSKEKDADTQLDVIQKLGNDTCDSVIDHVTNLKTVFSKDVENFRSTLHSEATQRDQAYKSRENDIRKMQQALMQSKEESTEIEFFVACKEIEKRFTKLHLICQNEQKENSSTSSGYKLEVSDPFKSILRCKTIGGFLPKKQKVDSKHRLVEFSPLKAIEVEKGNSSVTNCLWLDDNRIVTVDNKKRRVVDGQLRIFLNNAEFSLSRTVTLRGRPYVAVVLNQTTIAVSVPSVASIYILETSDFSVMEIIKLNFKPFGLAVKEKLYGALELQNKERCHIYVGNKGGVHLMDLNGQLLNKINISTKNLRNIAFSNGVVYGTSGDAILGVEEQSIKRVFHFADPRLPEITDVTVADNDLYVSCCQSKRVARLSKDGEVIQVFTFGKSITSLSFSNNVNRVCVVSGGEEINNEGHIYLVKVKDTA